MSFDSNRRAISTQIHDGKHFKLIALHEVRQ